LIDHSTKRTPAGFRRQAIGDGPKVRAVVTPAGRAMHNARMSRLFATYHVHATSERIDALARALALEQSVEVPMEAVPDAFIAEQVVGRVEDIQRVADDRFAVVIGLATATTGYDVAQTINMLFGNSSLHAHVELVDVEFPHDFLARFPGPRHGIEGIRNLLRAYDRPLTCAALKPQGLSAQRLAALCETFAANGVDIVKDDHGLADQVYAPFAERVAACQRAIERANAATGSHALYAPSLVGSPRALAMQARIARDAGVGMVLLAPALLGMPAFAELVAEQLDVPVLAHPAYAGAARVAPTLLLGKLFRWLGADAVIYPNFGGRFAYSESVCRDIAQAARAPWSHIRPMLPVPAGGLTVERVPEVTRFYGNDAMLLIGGALLCARDRLPARTREFTDLVRRSAQPASAMA
jgi:ribulose-bisphosphate carboxylase large chain